MAPNIFMSYSRREVGFVDDLTHQLEKAGFNVWLDYRRLIPGTPWAAQIDKGLKEAEVILLVVSKDSIASQYVELEWRHVLEQKDKRIILAIFESVKLPPELKNYEWVDFRGNYKASLKELISQLNAPIQEVHPAPETGFKAPPLVWITAALGLIVALLSLISLSTFIIPWVLVPFPWRVFKRNFNYTHVQSVLWLLPFGIFIGMISLTDASDFRGPLFEALININIFSILPVLALWILLQSPGMQRWGKPEATKPTFANRHRPQNPNPKPVSFFIDHAPQDRRMANELKNALTRYGHPQAADIKSAQAIFVLISAYKTDSEADPQSQSVFPVLIQTAMPAERLSKVQWIDLRKGLRNIHAIPQLLPDPSKMLTALGVRPTGNQLILPFAIQAAVYLLIAFAVISVGEFVYDLAAQGSFNAWTPVSIICILLSCGLVYWMANGLIGRRGWMASIPGFVCGYFALGVLAFFTMAGILGINSFTNMLIYMAITFLLFLITLFRFGEIRRWYPARVK